MQIPRLRHATRRGRESGSARDDNAKARWRAEAAPLRLRTNGWPNYFETGDCRIGCMGLRCMLARAGKGFNLNYRSNSCEWTGTKKA